MSVTVGNAIDVSRGQQRNTSLHCSLSSATPLPVEEPVLYHNVWQLLCTGVQTMHSTMTASGTTLAEELERVL